MLEIRNLSKSFEGQHSLKNISLKIEAGEIISIIGPSGAGKSTLLHCLNRLLEPSSGEIYFEGQNILAHHYNVAELRQKIGMVFQEFNLFKHLTVIENLMVAPVDLLKLPRQQAYEEAMVFLTMVGMAEKALAYPEQLSGGQKQRVAIARALAMHPQVILFDEPTSALDPTMVGEVLAVIRKLAQEEALTLLIVTHELQFAQDISSRILLLEQGQICDDGTPQEILINPQKAKTQEFVWHLKSFHYQITSQEFDFYNLVTLLENFGRKYFMPRKMLYSLQLVWEELGLQQILKQLPFKNFKFDLTVQYIEKSQQCKILLTYDGAAYNPLENPEDLSLLLIKRISQKLNYSREADLNQLEVILA